MRKFGHASVFALALTLGSSCGAGLAALLVEAVETASTVLTWIDRIADFVEPTLDGVPTDTATQVRREIARARAAAALLDAAGRDAIDLSESQTEEAFANLERAYKALLALTKPLGVHAGEGMLGASNGVLNVPTPSALFSRSRDDVGEPQPSSHFFPAKTHRAPSLGFAPKRAPAAVTKPWHTMLASARGQA